MKFWCWLLLSGDVVRGLFGAGVKADGIRRSEVASAKATCGQFNAKSSQVYDSLFLKSIHPQQLHLSILLE